MKSSLIQITCKYVILSILFFGNTVKISASNSENKLVYQKRMYDTDNFTRKIDTVEFNLIHESHIPVPGEIQSELKNENPFEGMQYLMFKDLVNYPKDESYQLLHGGDKLVYYFNEDLQVIDTTDQKSNESDSLPIPYKIIAETFDKYIEYTLIEE